MTKSAFTVDSPSDSPGFLLWQVTTLWQRALKPCLEKAGLSHAQFVIMSVLCWLLENQQSSNQADIAHLSKLDKMIISKSLKILEQKKLIKRFEDPKDTRAKQVTLTPKGQKETIKAINAIEGADKDYFSPLSAKEMVQLNALLVKLSKTT
jgi:DNA-binding MarR family transcriptional regulator